MDVVSLNSAQPWRGRGHRRDRLQAPLARGDYNSGVRRLLGRFLLGADAIPSTRPRGKSLQGRAYRWQLYSQYMATFGCGAVLVSLALSSLQSCIYRTPFLPGFWKLRWRGSLAGIVWAVGHANSVIAIKGVGGKGGLGLAIGVTGAQTALLIAGLWGILKFNEVKNTRPRMLWFGGAAIVLMGMMLLVSSKEDSR
mmetsp:Transcript_28660/g.61909  ORF Transcript_28660/g.61909 Transcript_28660/m.61909 type:complete len:196 (-) Transcript_28660:35-622(-)